MNMKYQIFLLFLFLSVIGRVCLGQTKPIGTDNYYIGSAEGDNLQKVRAAAIENMI